MKFAPSADAPPLPSVRLPEASELPPEMLAASWVAWRAEWRRERSGWKLSKVPCLPNGNNAGFDDERAVTTFEDALARANRLRDSNGPHYGVGITFARPCDLWILDLDGELVGDALTERLEWLCGNAPSWAEVSVSGTGLHFVYAGEWPVNRKITWRGRNAEILGTRKFVAITGERWRPDAVPQIVPDGPLRAELLRAIEEVDRAQQQQKAVVGSRDRLPTTDGDSALLDKARTARNGDKFRQLFDTGSAASFGDDQTRADLALCGMLAFWCQGDPSRIDRLFRQSGLMRAKWDERHRGDGGTYGAMTIEKAIAGKSDFYTPRAANGHVDGAGGPRVDGAGVGVIHHAAGDPAPRGAESGAKAAPVKLPVMTLGQLLNNFPELRAPLIEGLLRRGETMNIIASPKVGKSWLAAGLALAMAAGQRWLGMYPVTKGRVLIIDNELHPETLAGRLRRLTTALGLGDDDVGELVDVLPLRGRLLDLGKLGDSLLQMERGYYSLVILDAFYRAIPAGTDENDNGTMAGLYNTIDMLADAMDTSFVLIHHASKGDQSGKSITDVGAGAGAQSRATDTHLILRPHEEHNVVVLDAAVRSWAPVEPACLRWEFPLWRPEPDLDAGRLLKVNQQRKATPTETPDRDQRAAVQNSEDDQAVMTAIDRITAGGADATKSKVRANSGIGDRRTDRALDRLQTAKVIEEFRTAVKAGRGGVQGATGYRRADEN